MRLSDLKRDNYNQSEPSAKALSKGKEYYNIFIEKVKLLRRANVPVRKKEIYAEIAAADGCTAMTVYKFIKIYKDYQTAQNEERFD